jgi:uncharacterized membrane protein
MSDYQLGWLMGFSMYAIIGAIFFYMKRRTP